MDAFRIGHGYDSHRFGANRPLKLGGVEIPGAPGLRGHSDADALLHAIIDAVLGAAALGDIGSHFPDTDSAWRDADSASLLATVVREVRTACWRVGNVDATVICERPKLAPYRDAIARTIAEDLGISPDAVSVKATTTEGMNDEGKGLCISAQAIASVAYR